MKRHDVQIKRVYEPSSRDDGARLLVDRLWPRGLTKQGAAVDVWIGEIAPSPTLRKWFDHDPERFDEFSRRYRRELADKASGLEEIRRRSLSGRVTLLYGARDPRVNHAAVLREVLLEGPRRSGSAQRRGSRNGARSSDGSSGSSSTSGSDRAKRVSRTALRAGAKRMKSKAPSQRAKRASKPAAGSRRRRSPR